MTPNENSDKAPVNWETTHWSLVLSARQNEGKDDAKWRDALESLCQSYWFPVYSFLRRKGYSVSDAQDLTQGFFTRLIEKDFLKSVDPNHGRFRWFLMHAVGRYSANWDKAQAAQKRGGGKRVLTLDFEDGETRYQRMPIETSTPEKLFDRQWALALLDTGLDSLRRQYEADGKARFFETLYVFLTPDDDQPSYLEVANKLGLTETAVKVAIHRLRRKYSQTIRRLVSETLDGSANLDDEIDELMNSL